MIRYGVHLLSVEQVAFSFYTFFQKKSVKEDVIVVFYVFQGETYNLEREGNYVWSPQRNKSGGRNIGYTTMTEVCKDDFILHNASGKIVAISIAQTNCFEAEQPIELEKANTTVTWNNEGYRINCKYIDFDVPLFTSPLTQWLADHYVEGSAFTAAGRGKQQYLYIFALRLGQCAQWEIDSVFFWYGVSLQTVEAGSIQSGESSADHAEQVFAVYVKGAG